MHRDQQPVNQRSAGTHGVSPSPLRTEAPPKGGVTRRSFIKTMGVSAAAGAVETALAASTSAQQGTAGQRTETLGPDPIAMTLSINGTAVTVTAKPLTPLVEVLRWNLGMTGTKNACGRGACGSCTVLLDGDPVSSCMTPVIDAVGREITTIEGLAQGDQLDPLQIAFIKHDALQCGFCTPGLIMASKALLANNATPSLGEIKQALCGNLCRCGTYPNVFNAVLDVSGQTVPDALDEALGKEGG